MATKYTDVYRQLKADLFSRYPVGSFLPTEKELMNLYGASRTTIRRAISLLKEERLVDVRQGRGTQVLLQHYSYHDTSRFALFHNVSDITTTLGDGKYEAHAQGCIIDQIPAPPHIAEKLEIPAGTVIYRLERLQEINNTPFAYFKNYYRSDLFPGLEKFSGQTELLTNMYPFLEKEYHVFFDTGHETISAQVSSFLEGKLLGIDPGLPLLRTERIAYTTDHRVMEYAERFIRPDLVTITVTMSGAPHYD